MLVVLPSIHQVRYIYCLCFQYKKQVQLYKKRLSLTVIHSKDCSLFEGSEINKRNSEIGFIDQAQLIIRVDTVFFYGFPCLFLIFNIIYWIFWLT